MNEQLPTYKLAVILYPQDNGNLWYANITCNNGPTVLSAARPYADAFGHANAELARMLDSIKSVDQVEVWTLRVSHDVARELTANIDDALFEAIEKLPPTAALSIQHEIVIL